MTSSFVCDDLGRRPHARHAGRLTHEVRRGRVRVEVQLPHLVPGTRACRAACSHRTCRRTCCRSTDSPGRCRSSCRGGTRGIGSAPSRLPWSSARAPPPPPPPAQNPLRSGLPSASAWRRDRRRPAVWPRFLSGGQRREHEPGSHRNRRDHVETKRSTRHRSCSSFLAHFWGAAGTAVRTPAGTGTTI